MIFCLKIFWFIAGGGFFVTFPISSYFPKYRLLVSPIKWVLWDVPTNAEWSFAYLRHQAQIVREKLISRKVEEVLEDERIHPPLPAYAGHLTVFSTNEAPEPNDYDHELYDTDNYDHELYDTDNSDTESFHSAMSTSSILSSTDILAYRAQYRGAKGKFIIHSAGVRFAPSRTSSLENHSFNLPYHDISEMCKIDGAASKLGKVSGSAIVSKISKASGGSGQQLEFRCADSTNLLLDMAEDRDEAFNAVLGFSGVRWQSLQTGPRRQGNGRASGDGKSGGGKRSLWGEKGVMGLA
ncbi:hypothetical protein MMC13_002283 [Lambiella insularis]|nr:hypothetical protein [Lambiella insularis]